MLKMNHGHEFAKTGLKLLSQLVAAVVTLAIFTGFVSFNISADSYQDAGSSHSKDEVFIPDSCRKDVLEALGRTDGSITKADLVKIDKLEIVMPEESESVSFINYCTSMSELYIGNLSDDISYINQIDQLDNLVDFTFDNGADTIDLNVKNCNLLYRNKNIKTLQIYGYAMLEPDLVYSMPNLECVKIDLRETMPLDLTSISSLKEAYIYGDPYDISINLTVDDVYYLMDNGIEVFLNNDSFDQMEKIDAKLNDIISSLNIKERSTDQDKLDAIIVYALKNFTYDSVVDSMSRYDNNRENKIKSFYADGYLYGALELDTQLCGNYAAFVTAVATRLGLECYMMMSDVHCWNLVNVNGDYFYLDTTWMDCNYHYDGSKWVKAEELFEKGDKEQIEWYMDQPKSYTDYDHQSYNFPEYLEDELNEAISKGVYDKNSVKNTVTTAAVAETTAPIEEDEPTVIETSARDKGDALNAIITSALVNEEAVTFVETDMTINTSYHYIPEITDEQYDFMINITLIGVPTVIGILIIAAVCIVKAIKKRKREKETSRYHLDDK